MDLKLHGKSALVSGSTAGIGLAIAFGLAQEGASVIVNGRSEERVAQAIAKIKHSTPDAKVSGVVADAGTPGLHPTLLSQSRRYSVDCLGVGLREMREMREMRE